ncbi:MAG: Uma2 family endonuclease, partial [Dehalococcoidia bacterium]
MTTTTRISVAEYLALPEDGPPWLEYIDGAVTEKPVPDASHSLIEGRFAGNFGSYAESHGGRAGAEGRSRFHESPDPPYMLPDLSFFRRGMRYREGRMLLPPTLAVEIRSPGQTIESQRERCRFYLTHGAEEAWLVIPETRTIEVF